MLILTRKKKIGLKENVLTGKIDSLECLIVTKGHTKTLNDSKWDHNLENVVLKKT